MFPPKRPFLLFLLALIGAIPPTAQAQAPVLPEDPAIASYARLRDVPALSRTCATALQTAGIPAPDTILTAFVAASLHDRHTALIQPGKAITILSLRAPDGTLHPAAVLPDTVDRRYAEACAAEAKMRVVALDGLILMAPQKSEQWLSQNLLAAIASLHETLHPCDMVLYAQTDALTQSAGQLSIARRLLGLPPDASPVGPTRNAMGQIEWLSILLYPRANPPRVVMNLKAREQSPLFRFLSALPPEANALPRFLDHEAWLMAAGEIDGPALNEVLDSVMAPDSSPPQTESIRAALLLNDGSGALRIDREGFTAVLTPSSRHGAVRQIVEFMETLPATQPANASPAPPRPIGPATQRGQPARRVATDSDTEFEGFEVTRFYPAAMSERTAAAALAAAAFLGSHVAWCAPANRIETLIRRMILIDVPGEPLLSQKAFVKGANLYMDLRSPLDNGPWRPERAILLMARWEAGMAQLAIALPPEALTNLPRKLAPRVEALPTPGSAANSGGSLPSPIAP